MPDVIINEKYIVMLKETKVDDPPEEIPQILGESFYLQIGVYRDYNNARKVRDILNLKDLMRVLSMLNQMAQDYILL